MRIVKIESHQGGRVVEFFSGDGVLHRAFLPDEGDYYVVREELDYECRPHWNRVPKSSVPEILENLLLAVLSLHGEHPPK